MLLRTLFLLLFLFRLPFFIRAQSVGHYDVLIHEFFSDPDPAVGLPAYPFIELRNVSRHPLNLRNWKIGNGNTAATIKKDYLLAADSFLILCPTSAEAAYSRFGPAMGLAAFPVLNHTAGQLILTAESGSVIHAIEYDRSWYHNDLKSAGGWSLEMIDPDNPCGGLANWAASVDPEGGSPGRPNSVFAKNPDREDPELERTTTLDSLHLLLLFNEPLDSASAAETSNYSFVPDVGLPEKAVPVPPFYEQAALTLKTALRPQQIYTLSVLGVNDCVGNAIGSYNSCKAGLPEPPVSGNIIFNEILFNPPPYGFDYVELYNRSQKVIDLHQVFLGGLDPSGAVKDARRLSSASLLFFPGEYAVFTENPEWVTSHFTVTDPEKLYQIGGLPSMPDDQGTILLLDEAGTALDELPYDHHWHSPLTVNEAGVSLERIMADKPTSLASNWTSAAAAAGFGTPTYKNSAFFSGTGEPGKLRAEPEIFSPDNDGYEDFCFIRYEQLPAGLTANIAVYDIRGRPVRQLANNISLGESGSFRWDGLDDALNPLPMGPYVIYASLFSAQGKVEKYKLVVTLAKRN